MTSFFILLIFLNISWLHAEPLVTISQGILKGTIKKTRNGRNYNCFLAIPYAKPPIGTLRFSNPVAADSWKGVRPANTDAIECTQQVDGKIRGSEDCLYLNVHSPRLNFNSSKNKATNSTLLPVMVWIHGGAFVRGNSSLTNAGGAYLLDKDIVLVTLNYRLSIFGFFSTGDSAAPGNFGLKDQTLALKWVQKNIEVFGGDPKRVTLFGESAGGASVSLHAISKASDGLFHQYIIQSGSSLCPWAYQKRSRLAKYAKRLAFIVWCPFKHKDKLVACLKKKSVKKLMKTIRLFDKVSQFAKLTWTPTDEPKADGAFLTDSPENLIKQNQMKDLPFMTGEVADEGLLITKYLYRSSKLHDLLRVTHFPLIAYVAKSFLDSKHALKFTKAVDKYYFNSSLLKLPRRQYLDALTKFVSDGFFLYPEVRLLETVSPKMKHSIYFYSFEYRGTYSRNSNEDHKNLGVGHGDELTYLFPEPPERFGSKHLNYAESDEYVIDLMVDLWSSFAINGKPTSKKLDHPDIWVPYTIKNKSFLKIGDINKKMDRKVTLSNSYYTDRMNFWKQELPKVF